MNVHQALAITALNRLRGDDLNRARAAFKNYTPAQLEAQYGESGKTPNQIISGYEEYAAKIDAAIEWVKS